MKFTRKIVTPVTEIEEIFCNKCGLSCRSPYGDFYGLIEVEVTGGYNSTHLEDGEVHKFSLCERCVSELIASFYYSSFQGNYIAPDPDLQVEGFDPKKYFSNEEIPLAENAEFQSIVKELDLNTEPALEMEDLGLSPVIEEMVQLAEMDDDELEERISHLSLPHRIKKEDLN